MYIFISITTIILFKCTNYLLCCLCGYKHCGTFLGRSSCKTLYKVIVNCGMYILQHTHFVNYTCKEDLPLFQKLFYPQSNVAEFLCHLQPNHDQLGLVTFAVVCVKLFKLLLERLHDLYVEEVMLHMVAV